MAQRAPGPVAAALAACLHPGAAGRRSRTLAVGLGLLALLLWVGACAPGGGAGGAGPAANATPGIGDAARGKALFTAKGCNGCHRIAGEIAGGTTGPDLRGQADRPTIAGAVPYSPENLWRWLENPQRLKPGTAMPRVPLTAQELDDLVAYLEAQR